jgi:hypothetical protein
MPIVSRTLEKMKKDSYDDLLKEVFAQFGLAYYQSECLHRGLCICYAAGPFKDKFHATRPYYEERLAYAFALTLGQLSSAVIEFLPEDLRADVEKACEKRNFLAHHFWYDRCNMLFSENNIYTVLDELIKLSSNFKNLDELVSQLNKSRMAIFGIRDEDINKILTDIMSGIPEEPLPKNRIVHKHEIIATIWKVPTKDEGTSLLFQTEDRNVLQLCADGLSWSHLRKPSESWEIENKFQAFLPARVETRPKKEGPWNYQISFSTGIALWVKPGSREKTFRWGIKKSGG